MREFFKDINGKRVFQCVLVAAITYLAVNQVDGWGWLVFALLCTL
jgi:hypothetical protein